MFCFAPWWWWKARPSEVLLWEGTTMIFLGILISIAAIGVFCWLLFTLAVFALPLFAGISAGIWAYHTGAGWLGAIVVGVVGGGLTLGVGQFLFIVVRPMWAKLAVALVFVAPAAIAGYHAVHGIVKHTMPSEAWQVVFSIIGAITVGIATFFHVVGTATADHSGPGVVRS